VEDDSPSETGSSADPSGRKSHFRLHAPSARHVLLAGEFTEWAKAAAQMEKDADGLWTISLFLAPGRHLYKFVVDGEWQDDPNCQHRVPNTFGSFDSAIEV
jgi:1,4-alpha-glucan branching enzyme